MRLDLTSKKTLNSILGIVVALSLIIGVCVAIQKTDYSTDKEEHGYKIAALVCSWSVFGLGVIIFTIQIIDWFMNRGKTLDQVSQLENENITPESMPQAAYPGQQYQAAYPGQQYQAAYPGQQQYQAVYPGQQQYQAVYPGQQYMNIPEQRPPEALYAQPIQAF
jgi:hypothetical protein